MTYGNCKLCKKFKKLSNKFCETCKKEIISAFDCYIGGKKVKRNKFKTILNRGYVIPEELEDIRNE